jgi:isoamylase
MYSRSKGRVFHSDTECISFWTDSHFGYKIGHKQEDLSFDRRDNAGGMPKNRVIDSAFTWGADTPPRIPWHETLIYELHVKGFTMCHPDVPAHLRGTYGRLAGAPQERQEGRSE